MSATTPMIDGSRPPYRPALDGLRAIAVVGVLIFHLNPRWLQGGWLGVDLFFVLSGFLITTLILREQNQKGRINFPAFWRARMRRLLPALVTTLFAVIFVSWFLILDARRQSVAYDILAALGYVANWRFILGDEGYFSAIAMPSPVRHTWSLSIEEQFYVFFPLLMGLLGWISTRRIVHALALTALAAGSAVLMFHMYVPNTDPVRVYFGTDTRAFELLIGAVGAILLRKQAFAGFEKRGRLVQILGFVGLVFVLLSMVAISDTTPFPYRGGLVIFCLAAFAAILVAASSPDSLFSRIFGFAPFRWLGLISYPLYLWHWPVILFADPQLTGLRGVPLAIAQATISVLLAWGTYKFIETPIRHRKSPSRLQPQIRSLIVLGSLPLLVITAFAFSNSTQPRDKHAVIAGEAEIYPLEVDASRHRNAMILGNSIPNSLDKSVQRDANPNLGLISNTFVGCDPIAGFKVNGDGKALPTTDCLEWRERWPVIVSEHEPDITVFFVSQSLVMDRMLDDKKLVFGTPEFEKHLDSELTKMMNKALDAGSKHFALSNLACHDLAAFDNSELLRINDIEKVQTLNHIVSSWANVHKVLVIDSYNALCPGDKYSETLNGIPLYSDGLHFTNESGPIFWDWMAPQLIAHMESVE